MLRSLIAATALALTIPGQIHAEAPKASPSSVVSETLRAMTEEELARQRAGLMTPMGFEVGFGAVVRTFVDGQLALESRLVWTEQGVQSATTDAGSGAAAGAIRAAPGIDLGSAAAWRGVVLEGQGGSTVIAHDLTADRLASLVANTASNRDIRQETNISLSLPQLQQMQRDVGVQQMRIQMQDAVSNALRDAAR